MMDVFACFVFSIYEKLISYCNIDEKGTNYPPVSPLYNIVCLA